MRFTVRAPSFPFSCSRARSSCRSRSRSRQSRLRRPRRRICSRRSRHAVLWASRRRPKGRPKRLARPSALSLFVFGGGVAQFPATPPDEIGSPMPSLDQVPRINLLHAPTALEPLPRLSAALGGPQLWAKRDDCTGLALGGDKVRKLEYLLGEALAQGADTVITTGGFQSNHARPQRPGSACAAS